MHLSCPLDALPYTEVADDPGYEEGEGEVPPDVSRVLESVRDPQRVPSTKTHNYCVTDAVNRLSSGFVG